MFYQGFKVQYRAVRGTGDWNVLTVHGKDKRSCVLSELRPSLSYEVVVKAFSDQSDGIASSPVIVTTLQSGKLSLSSLF